MDPNAALDSLRSGAERINEIRDECPEDGEYTTEQRDELADLAESMAESLQALDNWISGGGFLPSDWARK